MEHVYDFYRGLMGASGEERVLSLASDLWERDKRISEGENLALEITFTLEELDEVLLSMKQDSAPGPDGLHAVLYKKFWSVCGGEITIEILNALNSGVIPNGWNDTTVVLIPKVYDPEVVTQFRPISLCKRTSGKSKSDTSAIQQQQAV
jgi:hypothetical protein